ncbi:MAG: hypothetical protein AB7V50_07260 [Vampirovibrionia bacterium]
MITNATKNVAFQAAIALKLDPNDNPKQRRLELMALTGNKGEDTSIKQTSPIGDLKNGYVFLVTASDKSHVADIKEQITTHAAALDDKLKASFVGSLLAYIGSRGNIVEIKPETPLKDQIIVKEDKFNEIKIDTIA